MVSLPLSYVAALFVTYLPTRIVDVKGKGGVFLPVLPLAFTYGQAAFPAALFAVLLIGALLSIIDATRGDLKWYGYHPNSFGCVLSRRRS